MINNFILSKISVHRNSPLINFNKCLFDVIFKKNDYIICLEQKFRSMFNVNYTAVTSSGREGMKLIIESYALSMGAEIIFPALTFYILPQIVKDMGYEPVFVNCNDDLQMDIEELKNKITGKTRVIVATHFFGKACEIDKILELAQTYNIKVIEDCAHCPAVLYKGKLLGTWGDAAFFSFQNRKIINGLTGGIVISNNKQVDDFLRVHNTSPQKCSFITIISRVLMNVFLYFVTNKYVYFWVDMFFNSKVYLDKFQFLYQKIHHERVLNRSSFSQLQARIVLEQLENIEKISADRFSIGSLYDSALRKARYNFGDCWHSDNYYAYVLRTMEPKHVQDFLNRNGIVTYLGETIVKNCGYYYDKFGSYEKTQNVLNSILELPIYNNLAKGDRIFVANKLFECLK